ncbi:MAG: OPT/YSL family transporter [Myxococcaceae bacterium]
MNDSNAAKGPSNALSRALPIGSVGYYVFLAAIAVFILGPLGGVTAAYMNFALGFFVGGQVLAGILGSTVTYFYGPDGKHGANYMQTMAASVASMAAMGVLIQAMVWLGMPMPSTPLLITYFLCIGMFGVGVGMLYTPILVDKLKLTYPSGLAVANILRALTDAKLLKRSVGTLGGGIGGGIGISVAVYKLNQWIEETFKDPDKPNPIFAWASTFSAVTFGGGMIVGARVSVSAILVGGIGLAMTPWLVANGYIGEHDPFRKIGFIFALGTILGAAVVDLSLLGFDAVKKIRAARDAKAEATSEPQAKIGRLVAWVVFWGAALVLVATQMLNVPIGWVLLAIVLAFVFQMINGISQGITDQNPISSAFVVTVLLMGLLGLRDPLIGLLGGSILLVSCTVGVDMQQDRSTGWRLGSDRSIQFRYQMLGIVSGAIVAVFMTRVFLEGFPVLNENLFAHPELRDGAAKGWQSAMTYKFVGVLNTLNKDQSKTLMVMGLGVVIGLVIEVARKLVFKNKRYLAWKDKSTFNKAVDFTLDALLIASPYASSFGGFVDFESSLWWGLGGLLTSMLSLRKRPEPAPGEEALPEDMSGTSLVGGGLIAGESLFALYLGIAGLLARGALGKIFG